MPAAIGTPAAAASPGIVLLTEVQKSEESDLDVF